MVHYDPNVSRHAAQTPAATCPKCGSHRTEVIDRSDDARSATVRCNECGNRSGVLIDRRASDADNMTDEVEAIRTIGRALAQLPDAASRVRVMRWASERFQIDVAVVAARAASAVSAATAPHAAVARQQDMPDPTLSMEGLSDFFSANTDTDRDRGHDADVMMAAAELDDEAPLFVDPEPAVASPREETPRFESMVRSLVSDFQRLALDLDTVFAAPAAGSR